MKGGLTTGFLPSRMTFLLELDEREVLKVS